MNQMPPAIKLRFSDKSNQWRQNEKVVLNNALEQYFQDNDIYYQTVP